ncbi:NAD(P)H-hydrate dehydratase, partial [Xylella fastidiosa]|uniref:NAD(P)H-hydrate dehydratase n=1 Tax=Xylella fastidiosa TaxID=2371 RepID=UPI003F6E1119
MGTGTEAANALSELFVLRRGAPLVLDADGLNLLAQGAVQPHWGDGPVVLTPHPAEAAAGDPGGDAPVAFQQRARVAQHQ